MPHNSPEHQPQHPAAQPRAIRLWPYLVPIVAVWTIALGGSLLWNQVRQQREIQEFALIASRASFDKDILYRRWNAALGGVYAPVTATSQPNPYLSQAPERDLSTPSGRRLTLINPAYMLRQVYELTNTESKTRGHITSTNPLRPENAPDPWELEVLKSFDRGNSEAHIMSELNGQPYLRLMRPLFVEQDCLKCHAAQGYTKGQIRGGISISTPLTPWLAEGRTHRRLIWFTHGLVWLLGMAGIVLGLYRVRYHLKEQQRAEQALRHSDLQLRGLTAAVPIGIFQADAHGHFVYVNERWCEIAGMTAEESIGEGWFKGIHPDDRERVLATWKQALGSEGKFAMEYRFGTNTGTVTWVSGRAIAVTDDSGAVTGYLGAVEEITGIKLATEELHRERAVVQGINSILQQALHCETDEKLGLACLEVCEHITGSAFGFIGELNAAGRMDTIALSNPGWDACRMPSSDAPLLLRNMEIRGLLGKALLDGRSLAANDVASHPDRVGAPPGHPPIIRFLGVPLKQAGQTVGMIGLANKETDYDEADRKAAEILAAVIVETLQRKRIDVEIKMSEIQHKALFDNMNSGVAVYEAQADGKVFIIKNVNRAVERFEKVKREEILGRSVTEVFPAVRDFGLLEAFERVWRTGTPEHLPIKLYQDERISGWRDNYVYRVPWGDVVAIYDDVTERMKAQEELQNANEFLEHVLNSSPDAIGIVNQRGKFTRWNKMAEEIFGYRFEELKDRSFYELYADKNEMERMLARLREQDYVRRYEMDMKRKDGSFFPSSLSISILRDHSGEVTGSICVARDITQTRKRMAEINEVNKHLQAEILDRERMEDAIQESNEKLKSLVLEYGQHNQEITLLNEMSDLLQACLDCEEAHQAIAKFLPRLFPDDSGAMYMMNRNQLTAVASWGESLISEPVFAPDACWALRRGEVHEVGGDRPSLPCTHLSQELQGATLCVPLTAQGVNLGLLFLQVDREHTLEIWEQPTTPVSEPKQRRAITVAKQISLSVANIQLRDSLRRQATRDPLTGIYNRRYLDDTLERELLRAKRKDTMISIIMVDIDLFKGINDSFGHEAGDTVLTVVAKSLKTGVRGEDVVCRYGGEEFILVLPEASTENARERAEHLRERIAQLEIEHDEKVLQKITASFGVATFPDHGHTIEEVIKAADTAMYRAKARGRNRVEVA